MKRFLLKITNFTIIGVAFLIALHIFIDFISDDICLNREIEIKISKLPIKKDKLNIIIAGDSRGERQIIPAIIDSVTGCNTINIAIPSGDLVTAFEAIKEHYLNQKILFVISASSWQINDGAIDVGYLSPNCFQKASALEKVHLYRDNLQRLGNMYKELVLFSFAHYFPFVNLNSFYSEEIIRNKGFYGISGKFKYVKNENEISGFLHRHPWYKNLSNNGVRWRIFKEIVKKLNDTKLKTILIQPPVSKYFKKITKNTFVETAEKEYSNKLKILSNEYENIDVLDFYMNDISELSDSLYYNFQHLNKNGAVLFSKKIAEIVAERIKILN